MILLDSADHEVFRDSIERFLTLLWDIGLEVGQSVRSVQECADEARADLTVITNMMESRTIAGPEHLRQRMLDVTSTEHMWPSKDFFLAKRAEQKARHHKYNDTEYNLEPNVKGSPGGLRDIQTILWVARRQYGTLNLRALAGEGFLVESENALLASSQEFLWKVRYALHMLAGRAEDRLLFDHQRSIASLLGFEGQDAKQSIENFMQQYYRVVMSIAQLSELIIQHFEEVILAPKTKNRRSRSTLVSNCTMAISRRATPMCSAARPSPCWKSSYSWPSSRKSRVYVPIPFACCGKTVT